mgnify:CR=1 FL=1
MTTSVSTAASSFLDVVKNAETAALASPLLAFMQAVIANPSAVNIALQLNLLAASALAAQAGVEKTVLTDLNALLTAQLQKAEAPVAAAAAAASA